MTQTEDYHHYAEEKIGQKSVLLCFDKGKIGLDKVLLPFDERKMVADPLGLIKFCWAKPFCGKLS